MSKVQDIDIQKIRINGGTQTRAKIDTDVVADYVDKLNTLPPAVVFFDGIEYWLGDGFHRYFAHLNENKKRMSCEVRKGTQRDAILFAVGANADHGLHRTTADKTKSVGALLNDPEWAKWSTKMIAEKCRVSWHFVSDMREAVTSRARSENPSAEPETTERTYKTKHGTTATMDTANIGKANPVEEPAKVEPEPTPPPAAEEPSIDRINADIAKRSRHTPKPAAEKKPEDAVGIELPKPLIPAFERVIDFRSWMKFVSELKGGFEDLCKGKGGEWAARRLQQVKAIISNLHSELRFSMPHAVCPSCGGEKCAQCKQTGYLPEEIYKATPDALKKKSKKAA